MGCCMGLPSYTGFLSVLQGLLCLFVFFLVSSSVTVPGFSRRVATASIVFTELFTEFFFVCVASVSPLLPS